MAHGIFPRAARLHFRVFLRAFDLWWRRAGLHARQLLNCIDGLLRRDPCQNTDFFGDCIDRLRVCRLSGRLLHRASYASPPVARDRSDPRSVLLQLPDPRDVVAYDAVAARLYGKGTQYAGPASGAARCTRYAGSGLYRHGLRVSADRDRAALRRARPHSARTDRGEPGPGRFALANLPVRDLAVEPSGTRDRDAADRRADVGRDGDSDAARRRPRRADGAGDRRAVPRVAELSTRRSDGDAGTGRCRGNRGLPGAD